MNDFNVSFYDNFNEMHSEYRMLLGVINLILIQFFSPRNIWGVNFFYY